LIHFTYLAQGVQRVVEDVQAKFPQMNKLISITKSVSESPTSSAILKEALADAPLPPPPNQCQQDGELRQKRSTSTVNKLKL
jgi:hypothetical protein